MDIGVMMMVGALVAIPAAIVGMFFSTWCDKHMNIAMRPIAGSLPEPEPLKDSDLPGLFVSILPIALPVLLVSANTITNKIIVKDTPEVSYLARVADIVAVIGDVNFAMLISAAIAMLVLYRKRRLSRAQLAQVVEESLMSGGVIILITAAGGSLGAMLTAAQVGPAIENMLNAQAGQQAHGYVLLGIGFIIGSVMKIAQGSSTVAMITASQMIASMISSREALGFHPVYLATAIGSGALLFSWMNDSGFWIFAKMGGLTEGEALKSWTPLLAVVGLAGFVVTIILATVLPLV